MDRQSSTSSNSSRRMAAPAGSSPPPPSSKPVEPTPRKPPPVPNMSRSLTLGSERTVKRLRLSKALTLPETTTMLEVCRRMAQRQVDAALLTDSNSLLCGILTDKDIATRVIARELKLDETPVKGVMTRNPVFVLSDTLAVESLQRMVQGKFRHLPVVENGEVIALLDIAKCLYDAIARMERASEKGKAIAAAVEGVEKSWGSTPPTSGSSSLVESLRDQMFKPALSTVVYGNSKAVTVSLGDTVLNATKRMLDGQKSSAIITVGNKPQGILTSRDILMRVIYKNLPPESTPVEKVMTPNPECGNLDTPILEALRIMQDGKFLHLPVVDRDGNIVSVVDVIDITHAAVSSVETNGGLSNEATMSLIQKFWDSAMSISPMDDNDNDNDNDDDDDNNSSETSLRNASDGGDNKSNRYSSHLSISELPNNFAFKLQDKRGRMHRFSCDVQTLTPLVTCILQRIGNDIDRRHLPQILYEDEDRDRVLITSDDDLTAAVEHAKLAGLKGLRLYLDCSGTRGYKGGRTALPADAANYEYVWSVAYSGVAAGAAFIAGLGIMAYIRKSKS